MIATVFIIFWCSFVVGLISTGVVLNIRENRVRRRGLRAEAVFAAQAQIRKLEAQLGLVQVCSFCRDRRLHRIIWMSPYMIDTEPLPMDSPLCEDCGQPFRPYLED